LLRLYCVLLQVGYSSDFDDAGDRHPAEPSEHHTYEVGDGLGLDKGAILQARVCVCVGGWLQGEARVAYLTGP
jgi:hypothetical protein